MIQQLGSMTRKILKFGIISLKYPKQGAFPNPDTTNDVLAIAKKYVDIDAQ